MKPYYSEEGIEIYHGDCREILPSLPKVDLVLTDPPYNLGIDYGRAFNDSMTPEEFSAWVDGLVPELLRVGETVLLTCGIANLAIYLRHSPRWILAWHKPFGVSHTPIGFNNWEPILFWGKWGKNHYSDYVYAPLHLADKALGLHACPKPLGLMSQLIARYSDFGHLVLDPFMGSGTTLRAAKDLGRRAIGIEIEEKYCEIAANRLRQEVLKFEAVA